MAPMNARLLRPRATAALVAVDADARAYINAVRIADGGQYMEPAVQLAIDDFVKGCKADDIWSALQTCCILMGARTLSGALTPLVGTAPTNNGPFVSGDYNRETGLKGDGTGKYLDSNRANNADGQNDNHNAVYITEVSTSGVLGPYIGAGGTGNGANNIARNSSFPAQMAIRSRTSIITNSANGGGTATGFFGINRSASSSFGWRFSGSNYSANVASQTASAGNVRIFNRDDAAYSDSRIAFYSIGSAITLSLLDSRVSTLYTAIGAAI